jgi:hypothetical protein
MATLTGTTIQSTYDSLLKVTDNDSITGSLKRITDGLGNNTPLYLSSSAVEIVSTLNVTSTITGSNLSGTNTGDETKASIETKLGAATSSNSGYLTSTDWSTFSNKIAGSGTLNTIPKFSSSSSIGNSNITDSGTLITLGSNTTISSGALGIGASSLTGYIIRIASNLTGATSTFGVNNSPTIQSDVTSSSRLFRTNFSTVAASFTLPNLYHFIAEQATIGAGSVVTSQYGFFVDASLIGATNNFGFRGQIPSSLNNYNLYMNGTAANYLAGDTAIGVSERLASSGPILTTTLTNGGTGYVDATYTDVAATSTTGVGIGALFTVVVSGGIVTSATLTWGGANWRVGDTLTISNTLLGGTGSGLVITVATVDSSRLKIANANGGDITLYRSDTSMVAGENIGTIKFEGNDASLKASGIHAKISAFGAAAAGGAYLSFFTRSTVAGSSLVEAMRINSNSQLRFNGYTLSSSFSGTAAGYLAFDSSGNVLTVAVPTATISGSGTTNYLPKFTSSSAIGNSLIYDNGTNVGIGIAAPFGRFHSLSTGTGSNAISGVFSDGSTNGNAITISNATGLSTISATYLSTVIDSALAFQTTTGGVSSERIRITASGNVGIGTTSPSAVLDVNGGITSSTNVRALRFWGGPSAFTTHSAPLHIFSSTIGTGAIARFNNNESTDASTLTSMWLENYAGYRAEIAYTTHLNGSNIYINNTYNSGNILFSINSSEKARILNTGQFKLNGYTSTSSFTGTAAGYLAFDSSGNILTIAAPSGGISGSGTTNYIPKFTGTSTLGNSLIFDNGTNVGIGTTSPSYLLHVKGSSIYNGAIFADNSSATGAGSFQVGQNGTAKGSLSLSGTFNGDTSSDISLFADTGFGARFYTNGVNERMRITSGGAVGIGTSSPGHQLHVVRANVGVGLQVENSSTYSHIRLQSAGTNQAAYLTFNPTGTGNAVIQVNDTDRLAITSAGNVGIGTTSPSNKLTVQSDDAFNQDTSGQIVIKGSTTTTKNLRIGFDTGNNYGYVQAINTGISTQPFVMQPFGGNVGIGIISPASKLSVWNGEITISNLSSAYTAPMGSIGAYNANANTGGLVFKTSNSGTNAEKVRITYDGYVGIGTTAPGGLLDINSSTTNDRLIFSHTGSIKSIFGVQTSGVTYLYHATSSSFPMWISAAGNFGIGTTSPTRLLSVNSQAYISADIFQGQNSGIFFSGDGSYATGVYGRNSGLDLVFQSNSAERARIASDGRFQVNNTGYSANCTATLRALSSTGTDRILECITIGYSSAFYVQTNGSYFFAGSNLSDARTKKDINYLEESILDKVMKLKPASFRYKENEENIKGGFIAQDIKEIFPDLVTATKSDDEMMGVDYYGVIAILTKAIQELKTELDELKNK